MLITKKEINQEKMWDKFIDNGSEFARKQLVESYIRLVNYVAGRMSIGLPHYVDKDDLVSAGLLGLIQAVDKFDPRREIKFETYAIPRIRGAILDELRRQDWFPRSLRKKARSLEQIYTKLEKELGRSATDQEVADELNISRTDLTQMIDQVALATIVSLDAETNSDSEDGSTTLGECLPDKKCEDIEQVISEKQMRRLIAGGLEELPEKEQLVLVLYYYEDLTLKEIGEVLEVTESRVCQIHTKAIIRLRSKVNAVEGKKTLNRITSEIRKTSDQEDNNLLKVNIMAGFAIPPMMKLAQVLIDMQVPLT
ncbi:FliA/WhiG family RNA polymerase sigma factor [bacterium]|jgi:RNA polymerase sigma factor for flagellar operon FliA|nr:FliA/WhiG family RNA polymerase sigma factor [bacterium]MBT4291450.1 FliA/WhiG family RNA polymerase sigma factor [bacterium]